jgi:predicted dehydrogenase
VTALRAGVIGLGMMGRNHLRVLRELPGVEVVGAVDPSLAARAELGSVPLDMVTADVDELLDLGLDLCVVAAPTLAHASIGLRLADAGVHALIEKPLAADSASCIALAQEFERRHLIGCVGHIERYNTALRAMRDRLGELGPVFQVATRRQGPFSGRIRDVGAVMDLATHDIDLTCWVTGASYLTVAAFTASPAGRGHEDLVTVSGRLSDGTVASHLVNWLSPTKERVVTITGAHGCLVADALAGDLWLRRHGADAAMIPYQVPRREALRGELEAFRDAVLGRPAGIVPMWQGAAAVAVAEAVIAAARDATGVAPAAVGGGLRVVPAQLGPAAVVTDRTLADWGRVR